jgi:hypothetical protein
MQDTELYPGRRRVRVQDRNRAKGQDSLRHH